MKVLDFKRAPNPRRLRLFVAEKQIDIEFEEVDIESEVIRKAAYYEPCLSGQFPVLELDDGSYLAESIAICRYLERLNPEPALFGADPLEEARVEMWSRRIELGLFRHTADVFGHTSPFFRDRIVQIPAFAESSRASTKGHLELIDRALSKQAFIAGDAFSVADITAYVAIDLGIPSVYELSSELRHIERWYNEMLSRPSIKELLAA